MRKICLVIFLSLNFLLIFSQNQSSQISQQFFELTSTQIKNIKQKIVGISLKGNWQCIDPLFYEPSECMYFSLPINSQKISQEANQEDIQQDNQDDQNMRQFQPFFDSTNQGQVQGFFWSQNSAGMLYFILYRDKYITSQVIEFNINLNSSQIFKFQRHRNQTKLVLFRQKDLITTVNLFDKEQELVKFDISLNIQIFIDAKNYHYLADINKELPLEVPISIRLFSQSIQFGSTISRASYKGDYQFLLLISLFQAVLIFINPSASKQNASKTRTIMFRISQWFIVQMYAFIFYFSIKLIKIGQKKFDTELGDLLYVGLLNIGIGLLFLRKYEMVLEKFTNKLMFLFLICFGIIYYILAQYYLYSPYFWILQVSVMMQLQITHSMINGGKGGLPYDLIGFMILSRVPLIYMLAIDNNFFRAPPSNIKIMILLSIAFALHWLIILLQSKKGGQFMIPNEIIPGFYDYYFTENSANEKMLEQCPICTTPINKAPDSTYEMTEVENTTNVQITQTSQTTSKEVDDIISKTVRFMKTPCGHIFHIDCLTKWMQAKLICPYCRSTLPQLASLQKE